MDRRCNFVAARRERADAGKMIFRDNKSHDCEVNEVTGLQRKRRRGGSHRPLLLKLETDGYPIRAIEGQVAVVQIALLGSHFPRSPFRYSSRCNFSAPDNKLSDRELSDVIGPRRFLLRAIRFARDSPVCQTIREQIRNWRNNPFILSRRSA